MFIAYLQFLSKKHRICTLKKYLALTPFLSMNQVFIERFKIFEFLLKDNLN